jgi:hypothetical protein
MPIPRLALAAALLALAPQTFRYKFDASSDLADFEVVSGSWSLSAGFLWCASKGERDELAWRRDLAPSGSVELELVGPGRAALALRAGKSETRVRVERRSGELLKAAVESDGKTAIERSFEAPATGGIGIAVAWTPEQIVLRVGDDEPLKVARPAAAAPFEKLSLLALKSQLKVDELRVEREAAATPEGAAAPTEDERIALDRAAALARGGDPDAAFEALVKALPAQRTDGPSAFPEPVALLLQELGARREPLRARSPLKEWIAANPVAARDGSATLVLPLRHGWSVNAPEIRQVDGVVATLACKAPEVAVEVYRYDQKREYWFGRDPKSVKTSGGGGPTLGRARAEDLADQHANASFTRPFAKSRVPLGGATAYEHELAWPDPDDATRTRAVRELFVLHRGDTWRLTIAGTSPALEQAKSDVEWLLATFRFAAD